MSFSVYPEYKESGVQWLGAVPEHWQLVPTRAIAEERNEKNVDGQDDRYLSLMANVGIIPYEEKGDVGNKKGDDLSRCKIIKKGDLVLNSMNFGIGSFGISSLDGICSPVYVIMQPRLGTVCPRYALRIFEEKKFQRFAQSFGQGILSHRSAIGWDDLKGMRVPLPPLEEQQVIADFLDYETARIDALIEEQQRLSELLKEKRDAINYVFVTKGSGETLGPTRSEIPCIGQFPEHWSNVPIGSLLTQRREKVRERWSETRLLSLTISGVIDRDTSDNFGKFPASFYDYQIVHPGDFVFCLFDMDETPRTVGMSNQYGMVTGAYAVFRCKNESYRRYLYRLFLAIDNVKGMRPFYSGLRKSIRPNRFLRIKIPVPPASEAEQLADRIAEEMESTDNLIMEASRNVDLLHERRSALISAAVTGEIDVRTWNQAVSSGEQELPCAGKERTTYG